MSLLALARALEAFLRTPGLSGGPGRAPPLLHRRHRDRPSPALCAPMTGIVHIDPCPALRHVLQGQRFPLWLVGGLAGRWSPDAGFPPPPRADRCLDHGGRMCCGQRRQRRRAAGSTAHASWSAGGREMAAGVAEALTISLRRRVVARRAEGQARCRRHRHHRRLAPSAAIPAALRLTARRWARAGRRCSMRHRISDLADYHGAGRPRSSRLTPRADVVGDQRLLPAHQRPVSARGGKAVIDVLALGLAVWA